MMKKERQAYASTKVSLLVFLVAIMFVAVLFSFRFSIENMKNNQQSGINGLLMLIEFERIEGVLQWEKELDARKMTALVKAQDNVLENNPEVFRRLASKGYEIAGGYDQAALWDMPYEQQYQLLKNSKEKVERITGFPMKVFGGRYFSYDENTLKAADALGIEYILGRGTRDVEAVIYQPKEYKVKIISVTNVDVGGTMGRGSLCDYSLWARGADPASFGAMINESIAKQPANIILVSHSYLGGTRVEWWAEYQKALESLSVNWRGFGNWVKNQKLIKLPNAEIPINREVKYTVPNPAKAIEDYTPISCASFPEEKSDVSRGSLLCQ